MEQASLYNAGNNLLTEADPQRQEMAKRYAESRRIVGVATCVLGVALSYVLINPAMSMGLREWAESISGDPGIVVGLYMLVAMGAFMVVCLPAYYVAGYLVPRKYGLVTMAARTWWLECAKGVAVGLALWVVVAEGFYWVVRANPDAWWLIVSALWWGTLVLWEYLSPLNRLWGDKLAPVDDPEITRRLTALAGRAGVQAMSVWALPVSKRMRVTNAWLVGLGRTRKIVVADTMLQNFNHDELEAILAHELAHHVHADIAKQLAIKGVSILATMFATYHVLAWFGSGEGLGGAADVATVPYLLMAFAVEWVFAATVGNYLSRRSERAADRYAMELTGNPDAFKSAMIKLADLNLVENRPTVGPLEAAQTHPTIGERVQMADVAAGRPVAPAPAQGKRWSTGRRLVVAGAIIAPLLLAGLGIWSASALVLPVLQGYGYGYEYNGYDGQVRGPAGAWPELVAKAQEEAAKVEDGMALYTISAYPVDDEELDHDSVLDVSFYFRDGKGKAVMVTLVDTDPPQAYYTSPTWEATGPFTGYELERARQALSRIKVGPRDVLGSTLAEGLAFGKARGEPVFATLEYVLDAPAGEAWQTGWHVSYVAGDEELALTVEPSTGQLLSRQIAPIEYDEWCEDC